MTKTEPAQPKSPLRAAIVAVQAAIKPPKKDRVAKVKSKRTGGEYTFNYADMSDVLAVALPVLTEHGVGHSQTTHIDNGLVVLVTELFHADDERTISGEYPVCAVGGSHQEMGAAMTYARRYSFCAAIGMQPDDDRDGADAANTGGHPGGKMSSHAASTELDWDAMVADVRAAKTLKKLNNWRDKLVDRKGIWPDVYISSLRDEIELAEREINANLAESHTEETVQ